MTLLLTNLLEKTTRPHSASVTGARRISSFGRFAIALLATLVTICATLSAIGGDLADRPAIPSTGSMNSNAGRGEPLRLALRVAGAEDVLFLVDTGSPVTILDKSMEHRLGKSVGAAKIRWPIGLNGRAELYKAPTIYLGHTPLQTGKQVATFDLGKFPCPGGRFKGILGTDCLEHYCVQLDFASSEVRFLYRRDPSTEDLGESYRLSISPGKIMLDESFFSTGSAKSQIDTGDLTDGAVTSKIFQQALAENHITPTNRMNTGTRLACFPTGKFGDETYNDLLLAEEHGHGFIGLRFLARHLVTFDFPQHAMYLKRR